MANTNQNRRDWLEGLSPAVLGAFDYRSLRFIEGAALVAGGNHDAVLPKEQVEVKDVRLLGSYNWTGQVSPVVLIPGSPRLWMESPVPFTLISDEDLCKSEAGMVFDDAGAGTEQATAILAMLAAVTECTPGGFQWSSSDFICDRNSLRNLLRWVGNWEKLEDFRIDISLAGTKSVVLTRWKQATPEWSKKYSFGFSYEYFKTFAAPGCELGRKACHDRIVSYDLGGLRVVSRFEADACLHAPSTVDKLIERLSKTMLVANLNRPPAVGNLSYRRVGQLVPQDEILELVTRTEGTAAKPRDELYTQMIFGATSHLKIALHRKGRFHQVKSEVVGQSPELLKAATNVQASLQRLRALLGEIQALTIRHGKGKGKQLTLLNRNKKLQVFVREEGVALPQEFENVF